MPFSGLWAASVLLWRVRFDAASPSKSHSETLAYLATAADYVWNPRGWEAVDSCRRAKRFVEIMLPLVEE